MGEIKYKNGDKYFIGKLITITPQKYFSFKELMTELNRCVDLPYGVRRVYSPVSGRELHDIDDLVDGSSYVCASFEPFKATKFSKNLSGMKTRFVLLLWANLTKQKRSSSC